MQRRFAAAVSVGGLASSGGAGVSLDQLMGRLMGVHFYLVPSSIAVETPDGVDAVEAVPLQLFKRLLGLHLPGAGAVKASLLAAPGHVAALAEALPPGVPLVLDPVHEAGAGGGLVEEPGAYLDALRRLLLPRAGLVTANAVETEELTGVTVADEDSMVRAARRLVEAGAAAAAVKGGHLEGDIVVDVLVTREGRLLRLEHPRVRGRCGDPHGGGCVFSAAAAAALALGMSVEDAFAAAAEAAYEAVRSSYAVPGAGRCIADPSAAARRAMGILESMERVRRALRMLVERSSLLYPYVPETGMNIAEAPLDALEPRHVPAVEGRVRRGIDALVAGCVWPGASSHMARLVLGLAAHGLPLRAAVNAKPAAELIEAVERLGMKILELSRAEEPEPRREGGTMSWVAARVAEAGGADLVYDHGGHGKEPMARFLGATATEAAEKLVRAAEKAARL